MDDLADREGRAIDVEDRRLRLLAHSAHDAPVDAVRRETILRRAAPAAVALRIDRLGLRTAHGPVRVAEAPELAMGARVCFPLRDGSRLLGFAWVLDDPALSDAEVTRLARGLVPVAAVLRALEAADDERRSGEQALVAALLTSDRPAEVELAAVHALASGALETDSRFRVLVGDADAELGRIRRRVGSGRLVTGTIEGRRVGLLAGALPDLATAAASSVPAPGILGVGDPVGALAHIGASHRQAVLAWRVARALPTLGPVAHFAALGAYGLLAPLAFPGGDGLTAVPLPALTALRAAPDGDELATTLRAVLDAAGDVALAATRLHVHRATLYRRLRRIEQVTGADLSDGLQRLHLHAGLLLDDLR